MLLVLSTVEAIYIIHGHWARNIMWVMYIALPG